MDDQPGPSKTNVAGIAAIVGSIVALVLLSIGLLRWLSADNEDSAAQAPHQEIPADPVGQNETVETQRTSETSTITNPTTTTTVAPTVDSPTSTSAANSNLQHAKPTTTTTQERKPIPIALSKAVPRGSGCTPGPGPLPDGEWYGHADQISDDSIEFDLACYYFGEQAVLAAFEDYPRERYLHDDYARNRNPTLRTMTVEPDVLITYHPPELGQRPFSTRGIPEYLDVWIRIEEGDVVAIWVAPYA